MSQHGTDRILNFQTLSKGNSDSQVPEKSPSMGPVIKFLFFKDYCRAMSWSTGKGLFWPQYFIKLLSKGVEGFGSMSVMGEFM